MKIVHRKLVKLHKKGIKVPLAMRHADFYLLDLFISCSAGDGSQDFCLLDKCSASELPLKPCCGVLKLWLQNG